jgi:hypothetical protein
MTDRYNGATRLRRLYGMRGYGVYCRVVELVLSAPNKKLRYDLDDLVFDIREDRDFIRAIVEDFELFVIDGDYIEDVYSRSPEAIERERQAQIHANRSAAAKKAAQTRRERKQAALALLQEQEQEQEERKETPTVDENDARPEPVEDVVIEDAAPEDDENDDDDGRDKLSKRFDKVKMEWNRIFKGSRRMATYLTPDAVTWHNFQESSVFFTDADYVDAFEQAKLEQFPWQLRDVLKIGNMQRLLTAAENRARASRDDEEELDESTKEMIEYGRRMGWNWDEK